MNRITAHGQTYVADADPDWGVTWLWDGKRMRAFEGGCEVKVVVE